jgi:MFS family permease
MPMVRAGYSMPDVLAAQTPLRFLARFGMTNFGLLQFVLAMVYFLHQADGAMLPGIFKVLEEAINGATPMSLAVIVTAEYVAHAFAVLVWGILADRGDKLVLLTYATFGFGLVTLATSAVASVSYLAVVRVLSGVIGASLGPLVQGIVGAACAATERGRAFGFIMAAGEGGKMLGCFLAGSTSHWDIIGGWRGAFVFMSFMMMLLGWTLRLVREEVRHGLFSESRTWARLEEFSGSLYEKKFGELLSDIWNDFETILQRRSFLVLILQGAFASTVWKALSYQLMWCQYIGFSDIVASAITSCFPLGSLVGALISGRISDSLAVRYPNHGRIAFGQFAYTIYFILLVLFLHIFGNLGTAQSSDLWMLIIFNLAVGFVAVCAYVGVVKPLFAEIVPAHLIAQVIALAAAFDGVISSAFSMPAVAYITENVFDYQPTDMTIGDMPWHVREVNAMALARAMSAVAIAGVAGTFILFGLLHFTYPRDRDFSSRETPDEESCFSK